MYICHKLKKGGKRHKGIPHNHGFSLGHYAKPLPIFTCYMGELTNNIHDEVPWCMLIIDNPV